MAFSRRLFLRHGVLAAAACASSPLLALGGGRPIGGNDEVEPLLRVPSSNSGNWQSHAGALDLIGRDAFAGAVGTNFKVFLSANTAPVWVTLLAVQDLPKIAAVNPASFAVPNKAFSAPPTSSGFVLVFAGSSALPDATHLFEHDALGRFALFTVPEGQGQQLYVAVVNRLDRSAVVIVPYDKAVAPRNAVAVSGEVKASAPTSSVDENPSHGLSGSRGARRGAVRD